MKNQRQHITETERNELLKLLQKFEELFDGKLGIWKIDPVDLKLKEYSEIICSIKYPVTKGQEEMFKIKLNV